MGVLETGVSSGDPDVVPFLAAVASAMAEATGTLVSSRQPAGTHPCLTMSVSTMPDPVGSRWTTHQPRARERMTNVSPLKRSKGRLVSTWMIIFQRYSHNNVEFVFLFCHIWVYSDRIRDTVRRSWRHFTCTESASYWVCSMVAIVL